MKHIVLGAVIAGLVAGCASEGGANKPAGKNMSYVHIQHVSKSWMDTPNKAGLMETALGEAKIAAQHATAAAKKPKDLGWMKMHTKHVVHAVDPAKLAKGPGMGYGVIKASQGVSKHIKLAASSPEASDYLKTHSVHVATSADNTAARGTEIIKLSEKLLAATSAKDAAALANKIKSLSEQLAQGSDANGDGKITWQAGEGGLLESQKHLGFIVKNAGL